MKPEHWESIIAKHLDGVATIDEVAELSAAIEADESVRSHYVQMARVHAALATSPAGTGRVVSLPEERPFWRKGWMKAAALFVVGFAVFAMIWFRGDSLAVIKDVNGAVRWTRIDGKTRYFDSAGASVSAGTIESMTPDSSATLTFADGSTVTVSGPFNLMISKDKGKLLSLRKGVLFASVVPQASSQPVRLTTTAAKLTVLGTRFEVFADQTQTKLSVNQGRVALQRVSDDTSVEVQAGYQTEALFTAEAPLQVMAIPNPTGTWTADLEHDVDHGRWGPVESLLRIELRRDIGAGLVQAKNAREEYAERLSNVSDGSGAIFAEPVRNQRETLYFSSLSAKRNALRPILLGAEARFRIQGKVSLPSEIVIGVTATNPERLTSGRFSAERQVEGDFDIEIPVHELHTATQRAVGLELLSWFCFTSQREAKLAITGVELIVD
ncbi:FecR family protein [Verrucomicrobia bacterium]|nr:FecR family protein [Verrucomicrobiota bacterium]MDB4691725.1 FecR family protein [Verrucomicrobiota bacterium]